MMVELAKNIDRSFQDLAASVVISLCDHNLQCLGIAPFLVALTARSRCRQEQVASLRCDVALSKDSMVRHWSLCPAISSNDCSIASQEQKPV
jgi:hypothetical protein